MRRGSGADVGTGAFLKEWLKMADKLVELAGEDKARRRLFSAGTKLQRAALYYLTAERMQGHGHPGRDGDLRKGHGRVPRRDGARTRRTASASRSRIASGRSPACWSAPQGVAGPAPLVVYVNGLDSCKELLYWSGLPAALARRGISSLSIDQPGSGEALRIHGLPATHATEEWATPVYDWLAARRDVDARRIGMAGISLGGYFVGRAVAKEPRFACGAVWGANHDWAEVQQKRLKREGENPVPHYWNHVMWVFGAKDMEDFLRKAAGMTLDGVMQEIRVPFLVTHGAHDRQISVDYAHRSYDQLVNSPDRELKIFTEREGGVEHVGADNLSYGRDYIADWLAEHLGGRTG